MGGLGACRWRQIKILANSGGQTGVWVGAFGGKVDATSILLATGLLGGPRQAKLAG